MLDQVLSDLGSCRVELGGSMAAIADEDDFVFAELMEMGCK